MDAAVGSEIEVVAGTNVKVGEDTGMQHISAVVGAGMKVVAGAETMLLQVSVAVVGVNTKTVMGVGTEADTGVGTGFVACVAEGVVTVEMNTVAGTEVPASASMLTGVETNILCITGGLQAS